VKEVEKVKGAVNGAVELKEKEKDIASYRARDDLLLLQAIRARVEPTDLGGDDDTGAEWRLAHSLWAWDRRPASAGASLMLAAIG
jgi:hypothetical protein